MPTSDSLADIGVIRRAQLRLLIDQRAAGNIAAFADQFGYSRSRVSQFLSEAYNEGRSIGERAARALEEAAGLAAGWLDQALPAGQEPNEPAPLPKTRESSANTPTTIDAALAEARQVFANNQHALNALAYVDGVLAASPAPAATLTSTAICNLKLQVDASDLEGALALGEKFNQMVLTWAPAIAKLSDSIAATMSAAGEKAAAAMRAESAQLVADAERTTGQGGRTSIDPTGDLSREVRSLSDRLMVQRDLAAQLLILAELRGMRAEQASDRFARGAVVLS